MVPLKRSPGGVHRSGRPRCSRAVKPPTWVAGSRCGRRANSEVEPRPDCEGSLIALPQSESNTRRRATFNPRGSTPWRLFRGWRRRAGSSQTNLDLERSASRDDADLARGAAAPNPNLDPAPIVARVRRGLTPVVWHKVVDAQRYVHLPPAPDRSAGSRAIALLMRSAKRRETCGA